MPYKKYRWSKVYESSEEELIELLASKRTSLQRVHIEAGQEPISHNYLSNETVWCAEGSASLTIEDNTVSMQAGDAVQLLTDSTCTIRPGISGCTLYTN